MEPTFKTIADLFQVPIGDPGKVVSNTRKEHGETADECDDLGKQCLSDGDFETAIRHFQEAIAKRDPSDVRSRIDLAGAYEATDQYPLALREYERALRANQDVVEPNIGISDLYKRYGRFRDAIEKLELATKREPDNAFFHFKLAETLREAGEPTRALESAKLAVICRPEEWFYHYWVGDLLTQMQRFDEALESLRAAIELSPGDDFLYLRAAVAFWNADRKTEAMKAVRLASDLDPAKHVYHGLLGILLEETGQMEEAKLESDRAGQMDRYDHDTLSRLLAEMRIED